mmetsp:Transcript_15641/g.52352  ORF Transcript_15641/g.52352 Transcript_15641/m.52352 type:complete len:205 (+) Transcript_15641:416-1030(+)
MLLRHEILATRLLVLFLRVKCVPFCFQGRSLLNERHDSRVQRLFRGIRAVRLGGERRTRLARVLLVHLCLLDMSEDRECRALPPSRLTRRTSRTRERSSLLPLDFPSPPLLLPPARDVADLAELAGESSLLLLQVSSQGKDLCFLSLHVDPLRLELSCSFLHNSNFSSYLALQPHQLPLSLHCLRMQLQEQVRCVAIPVEMLDS